MAWREYKYEELMEDGAGRLMYATPPELGPDSNNAAVARAQLQATYALACFALARELREADQLR
jgi:hypothetical protein